MSGQILDITPAEYHDDPCEVPSLSSSIAHIMVSQSPLHAWTAHPRLGGHRYDATAAMNDGQLIHRLVLGKGAQIEIVVADDFRTKAAREARDEALANGRLPVIEAKYQAAQDIAALLIEKLRAQYGIELKGESEVAIRWTEEGEHGPVHCRCMMDHLLANDGIILDVKKISSAHPRICGRHVIDYGYHIQNAAYVRALEHAFEPLTGRVRMLFLFMELEPPYAIVPARLDGMTRELGEVQWLRAVSTWERCLHTNKWPGYADDGPINLEAPAWALREMMEGTPRDW